VAAAPRGRETETGARPRAVRGDGIPPNTSNNVYPLHRITPLTPSSVAKPIHDLAICARRGTPSTRKLRHSAPPRYADRSS